MTPRAFAIFGVLGLAAGLAGCAQPTPPPRVVATLPPAKPPPPVMPSGGYPELDTAPQRPDGTYITPNFDMSDCGGGVASARRAQRRGLGCDQAGGGVVDGYNAWLRGHRAVLDAAQTGYLHDWEQTGWGDWRDAYENQQTRLYNFYSQSPIRVAFCAAARVEIVKVGAVADADLPRFARAALVRLDQPFIDFFTGWMPGATITRPRCRRRASSRRFPTSRPIRRPRAAGAPRPQSRSTMRQANASAPPAATRRMT